MGNIEFKDAKYWYVDKDQRTLLLDLYHTMDNISNIPVINREELPISFTKLLDKMIEQHNVYFKEEACGRYVLLDFLVMCCLMRYSVPVRVAEIGAMSGISSFHLATLVAYYNDQSLLCSVCNGIGNESGNSWLTGIANVADSPRLSMLAADYDDTMLETGAFELVIVNGSDLEQNPEGILKEAYRILKDRGTFLVFGGREEEMDVILNKFPEAKIFTVGQDYFYYVDKAVKVQDHFNDEVRVRINEIQNYLKKLAGCADESGKQKLQDYLMAIEQDIRQAIKDRNVELKVELVELQEEVLYAIYCGGE